MMHGIIESSDGWIVNGEKSPAALVAEAGYDVWLGNQRGNKYSRFHLTKDPDDIMADLEKNEKCFWDFFFDFYSILEW